tara:strand:+ start:232 stop:438 length:207 start_codon:yes stop_codon:yes gene_type:complete
MLRLFKANPVLTTENTCIKTVFQYALKTVVDDTHPELSKEERLDIYCETLLEVEELMQEFNKGLRVLN